MSSPTSPPTLAEGDGCAIPCVQRVEDISQPPSDDVSRQHHRTFSSLSASSYLKAFDLDGDGRINKEDLLAIVRTLQGEKREKKVYRGLSWVSALLLVVVLAVNASLTWVVVTMTKDFRVESNRLVPTVSSIGAEEYHYQTTNKRPLETAEALVKHTVATNKTYALPSAAMLMSMKSIVYTDSDGVHKHYVAGVTISASNATVYSTVPGIMFTFTANGMLMYKMEKTGNTAAGSQDPQQPQSAFGRRKLLSKTWDCHTDEYEDESFNEDGESTLDHIRVTECQSANNIINVVIYSILNAAGIWEVRDVYRWIDTAPNRAEMIFVAAEGA